MCILGRSGTWPIFTDQRVLHFHTPWLRRPHRGAVVASRTTLSRSSGDSKGDIVLSGYNLYWAILKVPVDVGTFIHDPRVLT